MRSVFWGCLSLFVVLSFGCGGGSDGTPTTDTTDTNLPSVESLDVPSKYSTIQAAINAAGIDAVIKVAAGTYNENIKVKDKITIEGAGPGVTLIKWLGTSAVVSDSISASFTKGVTITGVSIENGTKGIDLSSAIMIISNCVIENNSGDGVHLFSSPATISNCRISLNSGNGIYASGSLENSLSNPPLPPFSKGGN